MNEAIELLKLSVSLYFALAKISNISIEDAEKIFNLEMEKFRLNNPDKLEDLES